MLSMAVPGCTAEVRGAFAPVALPCSWGGGGEGGSAEDAVSETM
jgi:hypothetical protein